jgi:hypothetical protein
MILILQIAAGIVLGFLILQSLPRILGALRSVWRIALILGVVAGLIILGVLLESTAELREVVLFVLAAIAMLAVLVGLVRYSVRGLGYLYVRRRARIARSLRWTAFLRMLGVHPSWHTASQPDRQIAIKVGDLLFNGIWRLLIVYAIACALIAVVLSVLVGALNGKPLDQQKPFVIAALWGTAYVLPGLLFVLWINRRPRGDSDARQ